MPLSSGQILNNRYRIDSLLGQGGFGAVYRAWDLNMESSCAVKENVDTSQEAARQFKREAKILHKLRHPSLPQVSDHFSIPGQGQYLVMDYIEGDDLQEMLVRVGSPLPETKVLNWIKQVCDALEYLHEQNPPIIHRDLKPANIKITPDGKAILVDFGIAKVYDPKLSTTIGARAITPGYSPQEQYGSGATDTRTDIYAMGATLYHLLTGKQPPESIQRNIKDSLVQPSKFNPAISPEIEKIIIKAMKPHPDQRFQSITEVKKAILITAIPTASQSTPTPKVTLKKPTTKVQPTVAPIRKKRTRPKKKSTRQVKKSINWQWMTIGLAVIAVLVVGSIILVNQWSTAPSSSAVTPDEISVGEAYDKYQSGVFLLDVRTPEEWVEYHAPDTTLIPLDELDTRLNELPKDREIVVVCRSGNRSQVGRDTLRAAGFTNVTSMAGGLNAWRSAGYPTVSGQ